MTDTDPENPGLSEDARRRIVDVIRAELTAAYTTALASGVPAKAIERNLDVRAERLRSAVESTPVGCDAEDQHHLGDDPVHRLRVAE